MEHHSILNYRHESTCVNYYAYMYIWNMLNYRLSDSTILKNSTSKMLRTDARKPWNHLENKKEVRLRTLLLNRGKESQDT
jgi:hypothetical protein